MEIQRGTLDRSVGRGAEMAVRGAANLRTGNGESFLSMSSGRTAAGRIWADSDVSGWLPQEEAETEAGVWKRWGRTGKLLIQK